MHPQSMQIAPKSMQNRPKTIKNRSGGPRGDLGAIRGTSGTLPGRSGTPPGRSLDAPGALPGDVQELRGAPGTPRDAPKTRRTAFGGRFLPRSRAHPLSHRFADDFSRFPRRAREARHAFRMHFYKSKRMSRRLRCASACAAETYEKHSKNAPKSNPKEPDRARSSAKVAPNGQNERRTFEYWKAERTRGANEGQERRKGAGEAQ